MKKLGKKALALFVALMCFVSCIIVFPARTEAATQSNWDGGAYKKKVVSVLYDDSGSMTGGNAYQYALYALQMLMSTLSSQDTLVITPMNNTSNVVEVNLSATDRNQEIARVMGNSIFNTPSGGTPGTSIGAAVNQLTNRGLYTQNELWKADENTEHWLLVLTDGQFSSASTSSGTVSGAANLLKHYTSDYPSLKTIYFGVGSGATDLSGSQSPTFFPYKTSTTAQMVGAMQSIANLLTGRYTLDPSCYTVSGSTVTIDLDKTNVSFRNVSIIAQNCGATLQSATYNGQATSITNPCVITPKSVLGMANGYSAVLNGNPYLTGGKLVLNFSGAVSKDTLSVFAEPALFIEMYLEYKNGSTWTRTDMQYINSNLSGGDKIRVGYEVFDQVGGGLVNIATLFGAPQESVSYAGNTYGVGDEIPLVVGKNEITVSVSLMNGAYTMYNSMKCIIEDSPTDYRVELVSSQGMTSSSLRAQAVFDVYIDNTKVTNWNGTLASGYTWAVKATDSSGNDISVTTSESGGRITVVHTAQQGEYGKFNIELTVTSDENMKRIGSFEYQYSPSQVELVNKASPDSFGSGGSAELKFAVKADGAELNKVLLDRCGFVATATLNAPNGRKTTLNTSVDSNGEITVPVSATSGIFGDYVVELSVKSNVYSTVTETHTVTQIPSANNNVTVTVEKGSCASEFDDNNKANVEFIIKANGTAFSKADVEKYFDLLLKVTDPDGNVKEITPTVDSNGRVTATVEAGFAVFGDYGVTLEAALKTDSSEKYCSSHNVQYKVTAIEIKQNHTEKIIYPSLEAKLEYGIYIKGKQLGLNDLDNFTWTLSVTDLNGNEIPLTSNTASNGNITATLSVTEGSYGPYAVNFALTAPDGTVITEAYTVHYHPASVKIEGVQKGTLGNGIKNVDFEHSVLINGVQLTAAELNKYNWKLEAVSSAGETVDMQIKVGDDGRISSSLDVTSAGFGKYYVKLTLSLCNDLVEEQTFELKFYPVAITLQISEGGGLSLTQHQMTINEKAIKFELFADGTPFIFDNGLTNYKVLLDGKDITAFTAKEGNVLTYVPHADHFDGDEVSVGDKKIVLMVDCPDLPSLSTGITSTLTVTSTVYEIVTVDIGAKKTVDRFNLSELNAGLYFQVLRDGVPLPLEELQAEWNNGKIALKDEKGTFGWQFWIPCGSEATVEEIDGKPVIHFNVTKDWIAPFDTFAAMLMFNGDKPITVSYRDVSGTDAITFTPSGAWSYIWRILVILLTVHVILYIIGFFKCKPLPSGMFVTASLSGDRSRVSIRVSKKVNVGYKSIVMWHLLRFVPNKHGYLWYNQPDKIGPPPSRVGFDKNGNFGMFFRNSKMYKISSFTDNEFMEQLNAYKSKLRKYKGKGATPVLSEFTANDIRSSLTREFGSDPIPQNTRCSTGDIYGKFDDKDRLVGIIFFVTRI